TLEKRTAKVWVRDLETIPSDLRTKLEEEQHHLTILPEPSGADETTALAHGQVQAILHPPPALGSLVAVLTTTTQVEVVYNGGVDSSMAARSHVTEAFSEWRHSIIERRLESRGLPSAFVSPVEPTFKDLAPKGAILG